MNLPAHTQLDRPFAHRAAFLLNRNARSVNARVVERLTEIVPAGDLFLSRSMEEAERFAATILRRGYEQVYVGGGDGTLVHTLNAFDRLTREEGYEHPRVGLLKLGTGNAVAGMLGARSPLRDAYHVAHGGDVSVERVDMVRCEDGTLTPFAGLGYDGAVLNDYIALQQSVSGPIGRFLSSSSLGYLTAMLTMSVPRKLFRPAPDVKVTSTKTALYMKPTPEGDVPVEMPAGTVLYDGPAPMASISSVPFFGFRFKMFPFARTREGYMQLRIGSPPIPAILRNLWPSVWNGHWRHPQMFDFLVQDVELSSSEALDYQVGGDAAGTADRLRFQVTEEPIEMLSLGARLSPGKRNPLHGLLPSPRRA